MSTRAATDGPATSTFVGVAIPAYNEAATIGSVVLAAREHADEVVVVDDGSTDRTAALAEAAGATVVAQPENLGKGRAVQRIFEVARDRGFSHLVVLDGDWQHDPAEIPALLEGCRERELDVVVGSRYLDGDRGETPLYRRVGQVALDRLTNAGSDVRVTDSQSGYRAFDRRAVESLDVEATGFGVESEMLRAADDAGLRVGEVPISVNYDVPDPSTSNSVWHGLSVVDSVLGVIRDRHPLLFFGLPGALLTGVGLGYGAWTVYLYRSGGTFFLGKALFAAVVLLVGVLSVYSALLMNMLGNKLDRLADET